MVFCPTDGTSLRADVSSGDLIGTVIADRYLVNELLGEGGMGKVYLASHVRLPQKAAIKVLHQDMVQDAGAVARFNREAANAARIEHDRVARVFDFGETSDGLVYLAMEFVPGKTLRDLLNDSTRLTAVRAANLVYQVAEGLDAAHRLNIVHRDLKPDNILVVTDDNGGDRCKVVDFGIAKVTNSSETQLTQAGMLVGTPEFMSPEQVLGEQLDGRSDVYALALVAYELFTGELPFEGNTPERKLTARLIQDPRPLATVAPDVDWPAPLQEAFDHALVREPEGRTATALEFADAIVTAVEGWTGLAVLRQRTPMSTTAITASADESTTAIKRGLTSATNATASGQRAVAASGAATTNAGSASAAGGVAPSAATSTPPAKSTPWMAIVAVVAIVGAGGAYFAFAGGGSDEPAAEGTVTQPLMVAPDSGPKKPVSSFASADSLSAASTVASAPRAVAEMPPAESPAAPAPAAPPLPRAPQSSSSVPPTGSAAMVAPPGARGTSDPDLARRELDRVNAAMISAPDEENTAAGAAAIPRITQILPRLGTASDSAWAYLYLVTAHGMMERPDRACEPFRRAVRLAKPEHQSVIAQFREALTCAP